jgi:hypothetical protein
MKKGMEKIRIKNAANALSMYILGFLFSVEFRKQIAFWA